MADSYPQEEPVLSIYLATRVVFEASHTPVFNQERLEKYLGDF